MGNAINSRNFLRAFTIALIGLVLIGVGLISSANAADSCTSEAVQTSDGHYNGCRVTMGNREFTIGAAQSSADGCSQVCGIMAEVNGSGMRAKDRAAGTASTFHQ